MTRRQFRRPWQKLEAKRRELGVTFEQAAKYLGWDPGSLTEYVKWDMGAKSDQSRGVGTFPSHGPRGPLLWSWRCPRRKR